MAVVLPPVMETIRQALLVPPPAFEHSLPLDKGSAFADQMILEKLSRAVSLQRRARAHASLLRAAARTMIEAHAAGDPSVTAENLDQIISACTEVMDRGRAALEMIRPDAELTLRSARGLPIFPKIKRLSGLIDDTLVETYNATVGLWQAAVALRGELTVGAAETTFIAEDALGIDRFFDRLRVGRA